jgi:hypothetical protein
VRLEAPSSWSSTLITAAGLPATRAPSVRSSSIVCSMGCRRIALRDHGESDHLTNVSMLPTIFWLILRSFFAAAFLDFRIVHGPHPRRAPTRLDPLSSVHS